MSPPFSEWYNLCDYSFLPLEALPSHYPSALTAAHLNRCMKWYRSLCRRPGRIFQPHVSSSHLHVHIFRMENLPYFRSFCQCGRWKFILLWDVRGVCRFHIHLSAFILLHGLKPTDILLLDIICVYIYIYQHLHVCMYVYTLAVRNLATPSH